MAAYAATGTQDSTGISGGDVTCSPDGASSPGDLLIAHIALGASGTSPDPGSLSRSSGWSSLQTKVASGSTQAVRIYLWYRIADGTSSDTVTGTHGGDNTSTTEMVIAGHVHRFTGVYNADPFGDSGNYAHTAGTTSLDTSSGITLEQSDSLVCAFFAAASNTAWPQESSPDIAFASNVGSMSLDLRRNFATGSDCSIQLWSGDASGTGATGALTTTMTDTDMTAVAMVEILPTPASSVGGGGGNMLLMKVG